MQIFEHSFLSSLVELKSEPQLDAWGDDECWALFASNVWLLPLCKNGHWTVYLVDFQRKLVTFLNSLKSRENQTVANRCVLWLLRQFKSKYGTRKQLPELHEWKLYIPQDLARQKVHKGDEDETNNCAPHMMLHMWAICAKEGGKFCDEDVTRARRNIANYMAAYAEFSAPERIAMRKVTLELHEFETDEKKQVHKKDLENLIFDKIIKKKNANIEELTGFTTTTDYLLNVL